MFLIKMTDYYYRLVTILVNICPRPLRELFLKHAAADTNLPTAYTTLDAYLSFRKKDIYKLTQKPKCVLRKDQFNLLFPGQGQADINGWDETLLSVLLKNLFQIAPKDMTRVDNIRKHRNDLQHIAGTCNITEQEFKDTFKQLSADTISLALSVNGQGYADNIKDDIADVETSVLTNLGDVLRDWYMNKIMTLETEIDNLKEQIKDIKGDTGKTIQTLKKTTVKRTRTGGKIQKRLKTVDHILENMRSPYKIIFRSYLTTCIQQDILRYLISKASKSFSFARNFESLLKNKLDDDFRPPPETARITKELEENHLVIVSGYGKGLYLQAALSVIESREYAEGDCVMVSNPSDWRHIGYEDAGLVVLLHPFGEKAFDNEKAKSMFSILDNVQETSTVQDNGDVLDVVIITDQSILEESMEHFSHDMIENSVVVYKPTTKDSPVDLCEVQSIAYYKHHKAQMVDNSLKEDAFEIFRSKKVVFISGERGNGKTTLALSLLSSYQDGHYLILTEPDDLSCIRFGVTCVVMIEDLGGKYMLDKYVLRKWLRKFDMLHAAVKEGILNVIITCLPDRLSLCVADSKHPMLDSVLELPKLCQVKIKKESSADCDIVSIPARINQKDTSFFTNVKGIHTHDVDLPENFASVNTTQRFCQHPDGSFLVLVQINDTNNSFSSFSKGKIAVQNISSDFECKCNYDTDIDYDRWPYRCGICCTDTGDVVITYRSGVRLYRISSGTLQLIKFTKFDHICHRMSFRRNRIFCYHEYDSKISILDINLITKRNVTLAYQNKDDGYVPFVPCCLHLYFLLDPYSNLILYEDTRLKQIKYLSNENFHPVCICAATEDSVFMCEKQGDKHARIIQMNSDMEVLTDISIEGSIQMNTWRAEMVYDRNKGRLVISGIRGIDDTYSFITINLE